MSNPTMDALDRMPGETIEQHDARLRAHFEGNPADLSAEEAAMALRAGRNALMQSRAESLNWQLTMAVSALENWGRHHEWCAVNRPVAEGSDCVAAECDCGLKAAIQEARAHTEPVPVR